MANKAESKTLTPQQFCIWLEGYLTNRELDLSDRLAILGKLAVVKETQMEPFIPKPRGPINKID